MKLENIRKDIDKIDKQILILLKKRHTLSRKIGLLKKRTSIPITDKNRENSILKTYKKRGKKLGLKEKDITRIFKIILNSSKEVQNK